MKIIRKMMPCSHCNRVTAHSKNDTYPSTGQQFAHVAITVLTFGFWLLFWIPYLIYHTTLRASRKWHCENCGR